MQKQMPKISPLKVLGYITPQLSRLCVALRKGRDIMKERTSSDIPVGL